ncbi:hypothetical protein HELRODRAFT_172481 [Helobdella robusta]|uniref:Uncharacterized protein n=1 Tax=Helobdella robusta TaxID=6412 RepID=T1F5D7_HELRO|nr:hypothetical protein HELRODRAFT_172481 [Helobdella robusta]ESO04806.1 hypothetical protein HELRODRAFT_172481 [Helobdella robusta]
MKQQEECHVIASENSCTDLHADDRVVGGRLRRSWNHFVRRISGGKDDKQLTGLENLYSPALLLQQRRRFNSISRNDGRVHDDKGNSVDCPDEENDGPSVDRDRVGGMHPDTTHSNLQTCVSDSKISDRGGNTYKHPATVMERSGCMETISGTGQNALRSTAPSDKHVCVNVQHSDHDKLACECFYEDVSINATKGRNGGDDLSLENSCVPNNNLPSRNLHLMKQYFENNRNFGGSSYKIKSKLYRNECRLEILNNNALATKMNNNIAAATGRKSCDDRHNRFTYGKGNNKVDGLMGHYKMSRSRLLSSSNEVSQNIITATTTIAATTSDTCYDSIRDCNCKTSQSHNHHQSVMASVGKKLTHLKRSLSWKQKYHTRESKVDDVTVDAFFDRGRQVQPSICWMGDGDDVDKNKGYNYQNDEEDGWSNDDDAILGSHARGCGDDHPARIFHRNIHSYHRREVSANLTNQFRKACRIEHIPKTKENLFQRIDVPIIGHQNTQHGNEHTAIQGCYSTKKGLITYSYVPPSSSSSSSSSKSFISSQKNDFSKRREAERITNLSVQKT